MKKENKIPVTENVRTAAERLPENCELNLSDFALFLSVMQNDTKNDDVRKRSRYYQGLLDSPILKSGRKTKYKELPSTVIIFITQEDIFGEDRVMYTFTEQCEEVAGLKLEDGTTKIFLNMKSKNGRPELVSLLQYMKDTRINNPEMPVRDGRIQRLDRIVQEVKQSEEWEAVKMNILEIGMKRGEEIGMKRGEEIGIERGEKIGIERGAEQKLIEQICKKLRKGKSIECIADEVEESAEKVAAICETAQKYAPEYDEGQVYREYCRIS